jgi:hypothetical protein
MCVNAQKTAGDLLAAIEPTINSLLTEANLANTTEGKAAVAAYDSAVTDLQDWTPGTPATEVLKVIEDFQIAFNALPLPTTVQTLTNIILAGVETVIGVITANSPAPAAPATTTAAGPLVAHADVQAAHQVEVVAATTAKVQTLVPGFKRSVWHSAATQYKNTWNDAVKKGKFPATLKAA